MGLDADYGEVRWNERYVVPGDAGVDVCDYRWRGILVDLVTAVAPEAIVRYLVTGAKEDNSVTLGDPRVNREAQE